jgi:hypothetical protein
MAKKPTIRKMRVLTRSVKKVQARKNIVARPKRKSNLQEQNRAVLDRLLASALAQA